jgi:DNA replication and repair protein RecF
VGAAVSESESPGAPADSAGTVTLHTLSLRDFRNLARVRLNVPPDGMAIVGDNGHGKTNLLEAIYYLQLLRSGRGARDQDVVRFGAEGFHIAAEATVERRHTLSAAFQRAGKKKKVTVDGVEPPRLSDALGSLPTVMFSPRDVELVAGAPSERRRFLDVTLALTSRRYLTALQHYRAALVRRNAALRDAARRGESAGGLARAAVWEPALAEHGALLWSARVLWVERFGELFWSLCKAIGERGDARMRYATTAATSAAWRAGASIPELATLLADALASHRAADLRRGLTHAGPHRDDLDLTLDGRPLRGFGSAGQQRTASIALRLLEAATLRGAGSAPLVLLDDPFAELDAHRSARILELLATSGVAHQTILAVPRLSDIPSEMTSLPRYRIVDGVVSAFDDESVGSTASERAERDEVVVDAAEPQQRS